MTYRALATDYDETLAQEGRVDADTLVALECAREHGIRLIMVTGRELDDLLATFPQATMFDRVVAENGAILYDPSKRARITLSVPPPPALLEALAKRGVPVSVGRSIVATIEPYDHHLFTAIHNLGLEWHVIFNRGSVMALPADVTKATGLTSALKALDIAASETIGVGDAENDQTFLRMCGLSVAVDNALPSVKEMADFVTSLSRGAGVAELINLYLSGALERILPNPANHIAPSITEREV
jgi:hydroxymethylpyrimidine pyrophosphatase-like HAD family hydrolase